MTRRRMLAWLAAAPWALTVRAVAEAAAAPEYAVKATYLYKFSAFVEWPPAAFAPGAPFIIGVLGEDPFGATLDASLENRTVDGRPVAVRRYRRAEDAAAAHVLFLGSGRDAGAGVPAALAAKGVLTVADTAATRGSVVNFVIQDNRVRFEIDPAAGERAGLKLSSKLLSLAVALR